MSADFVIRLIRIVSIVMLAGVFFLNPVPDDLRQAARITIQPLTVHIDGRHVFHIVTVAKVDKTAFIEPIQIGHSAPNINVAVAGLSMVSVPRVIAASMGNIPATRDAGATIFGGRHSPSSSGVILSLHLTSEAGKCPAFRNLT